MMKKEVEILDTKGREYARDEYGDDVLANFKRKAKTFNVDLLKVWGIDFEKHVDAILNFVRTGQVLSESIASRFHDARNYLILGMALIQEHVEAAYEESIVHEPVGQLGNKDSEPEFEIYKDTIGRTRKRRIISSKSGLQSATDKTLTKRKRRRAKPKANEQD